MNKAEAEKIRKFGEEKGYLWNDSETFTFAKGYLEAIEKGERLANEVRETLGWNPVLGDLGKALEQWEREK